MLIISLVLALAALLDWAVAQILVFAASKVFGFETNIWQVVLVFVGMGVLGMIFKSGKGTKED